MWGMIWRANVAVVEEDRLVEEGPRDVRLAMSVL